MLISDTYIQLKVSATDNGSVWDFSRQHLSVWYNLDGGARRRSRLQALDCENSGYFKKHGACRCSEFAI